MWSVKESERGSGVVAGQEDCIMARPRAASSWPRVLHPSYYLRRPRRLLVLVVFFVGTTFLLWDRHNLIQNHESTLAKINEQKEKLTHKLEELAKYLKGEGKTFQLDGEDESSSKTAQQGKSEQEGVEKEIEDPITEYRRSQVKAAMQHAWSSYEKYAWGFDELQPQSRRGVNHFGGLGATIIDSLDTLYIMGLQTEFNKARDWVAENLHFNKNYDASVFETTIRVLGGLLSAYDLTAEKMFLTKAKEIADRLLPAWDTRTGIPYTTINLDSGRAHNPGWTGGSSVLADLGTEQVEFIGLSQRTGDPKYKQKVENVIKQLRKIFPKDGLLPIYISADNGQPTTGKITFGAMGDSFYEYLLKVWIQGNKTEVVKHYREMWEQSMEGIMGLVSKSTPSGYTFLAERSGSTLYNKMDELACFAPGMLALGTEGAPPEKAEKYLTLAKELTRTCYNFYMSTPTKLAGENYQFYDGQDMQVGTPWNILRPETVESLMYVWRKTGDSKYRDWGWDIFQAFEKQSRTPTGYVGLRNVRTGEKDDMMQSFFVAETLKYFYLLYSPSSVIPLDKWVFNTEAHPLRIIPRVDEPISLEDTPEGKDSSMQIKSGSTQYLRQRRINPGGR
ncbi:hypothetical protein CY35_07G122600 [Sphagnum magellanicum]|uniref:Uncharacterized protein n=1 Tax=Sphagnum magellanicum TaxID=128215 RepID=A0ACB8HPQ1_9BRYO|nr:hypothetical protein CY35_07G122600 [Sphagnum magellanicum]